MYGDMAMKTTLNIADSVFNQLKREAARQGRTMGELVESGLRLLFHLQKQKSQLPPLPTFSSEILVDPADRNALYDAMEEES